MSPSPDSGLLGGSPCLPSQYGALPLDLHWIPHAAPLVDPGTVLLGLTPKSHLIAFEPSDKEYKELASVKVADTPVYAHPVVLGKRLFVKDQDSITLWTVE